MQIQRSGKKALCEFRGRLLYEQLAEINRRIEDLLGDGVSRLLLKIDQLRYLDSSALGMVLSLHAKCGARGGRLSILCPPENIDAMLKSTRLDQVLDVLTGEDARVAEAEVLGEAMENGAA